MNIDELTLAQLKEIRGIRKGSKDFVVGEVVLIRTVTFYWIGKVTAETTRFVTLEPAACIFDVGRFANALADGTLKEIEPVAKGRVRVGIGAIVDAEEWEHDVPLKQK